MEAKLTKPIEIFYCCSHAQEDQLLCERLKIQLSPLERDGLISSWHDRKVLPGKDLASEIEAHLNSAQIILLLFSPDFMNEKHCEHLMERALERQETGEVRVIPVILRPVDWQHTPFGKLQPLPTNRKPITTWSDRDEAFLNTAGGIRQAVQECLSPIVRLPILPKPPTTPPGGASETDYPQGQRHPLWVRLGRRPLLVGLGVVSLAAITGVGLELASGKNRLTSGNSTTRLPTTTSSPVGTHLYTYPGHDRAVSAVAWSPDGQRIVSGSYDWTVQVWDALTGHNLIYYRQHSDEVNTVGWSPNGLYIASGSYDQTVQVWKAANGSPVLSHDAGYVETAAWSPNGEYIASAGDDNTVQVWHAATGSNVFTYRGHKDIIWSVAWSHDGKYLASASEDHTVQVWNAITGDKLYTYTGHTAPVKGVTWSPSDMRVASGGYDKTVQVWNVATGSSLYTYPGHSDKVRTVAWSHDGKYLASGGYDKTVQVWNPVTEKHLYTYTKHSDEIKSVAWSPNDKLIVSGSVDQTAQVWVAS